MQGATLVADLAVKMSVARVPRHSFLIFIQRLNDAELALVKHKIEQHVSPEIAEARDTTLKAMKEAEQGWQRAIAKIGERAGLTKGADGTWRDPSMSEAA